MPTRIGQGIDAVYVLSVKTFSQRIAHIKGELERHGIPFEFVFEHDASEIGRPERGNAHRDDRGLPVRSGSDPTPSGLA